MRNPRRGASDESAGVFAAPPARPKPSPLASASSSGTIDAMMRDDQAYEMLEQGK
jgi:hypothetical protein